MSDSEGISHTNLDRLHDSRKLRKVVIMRPVGHRVST